MPALLATVLAQHHVLVPTDNDFQRRARLLQALWRESRGLPIGENRGTSLGSRLAMPDAELKLTNYLTDTIRDVVRREVRDPARSSSKLFGKPRIWNDLLSSQPLCFNLFGELQQDLVLASRVLGRLSGGRIAAVTGIEFEHSPARGDARYTGDRSAFDVFVEYTTGSGTSGFAGVEVKYHESLGDPPARHRPRYDEIAAAMGVFNAGNASRLMQKPLQQIWRDHLLAGSLLLDPASGYQEGVFVVLHPALNIACSRAVAAYKASLLNTASFASWTLEDFAAAVLAEGAPPWMDLFIDRYLAFEKCAAAT
jgi:hypothetical protein